MTSMLDQAPEADGNIAVSPAPRPRRSITVRGRSYPVQGPRLRDPRLWVAGVTLSVHALGQIGLRFQLSVPQLLSAMVTAALIEVTLTFRSHRMIVWPASALLTASGIALILRVPTTPLGDHWTFHKWYVYAGVTAFALITKNVVRYRGAPLFNPSNIALVLAFIVLGSSRVEPLDFWWAPLNGWMIAAYVIIVAGGAVITRHLRLLTGAIAFWVTLAAGTALVAAFGHCMTARWAFAPVCGMDYWRAIVTSPEVLIFTLFMITDPKTVPRGRVGHASFCVLVGVACVLLMAPQSTEFWSKVALLGGLTAMCVLRPLIELALPERDSAADHMRPFLTRLTLGTGTSTGRRIVHGALVAVAIVAVPVGVVAAGVPARGTPLPGVHEVLNRVPHQIDPSTLPDITVDASVTDWNHEISGDGAEQIVLTLVENLELETQALLRNDETILTAVDHGDRLDDLRNRLSVAARSGTTVVRRYRIESVRMVLEVPFGRQDGLSVGLQSRGSVTVQTYDAAGNLQSSSTEPLATTFVMRRATGDRWLNVAEVPPEG